MKGTTALLIVGGVAAGGYFLLKLRTPAAVAAGKKVGAQAAAGAFQVGGVTIPASFATGAISGIGNLFGSKSGDVSGSGDLSGLTSNLPSGGNDFDTGATGDIG